MLQQQLDDLQTAHHEAQTELIQLKKDAKKATALSNSAGIP
jgi:hypothetical protein